MEIHRAQPTLGCMLSHAMAYAAVTSCQCGTHTRDNYHYSLPSQKRITLSSLARSYRYCTIMHPDLSETSERVAYRLCRPEELETIVKMGADAAALAASSADSSTASLARDLRLLASRRKPRSRAGDCFCICICVCLCLCKRLCMTIIIQICESASCVGVCMSMRLRSCLHTSVSLVGRFVGLLVKFVYCARRYTTSTHQTPPSQRGRLLLPSLSRSPLRCRATARLPARRRSALPGELWGEVWSGVAQFAHTFTFTSNESLLPFVGRGVVSLAFRQISILHSCHCVAPAKGELQVLMK